jgi:DNA-binding CsgD family transcriptional regulator
MFARQLTNFFNMKANKNASDFILSTTLDDAKRNVYDCYSIISQLDKTNAISKECIAKLYKLCATGNKIISKWTEAEIVKRAFLQSDICHSFKEPPFRTHRLNEWESLQTSINEAYNGFSQRLMATYKLNERELRVSLLLKINLSPSHIALSIPCSKETVTSIRRRLSAKYLSVQNPKEWDKLIAAL